MIHLNHLLMHNLAHRCFPFIVIFSLIVFKPLAAQKTSKLSEDQWIDSVFQTLDRPHRIAQLLMVRAYSNRDTSYTKAMDDLIRTIGPGGVCFFQGGPARQILLTNKLQQISEVPLLVAMDAEWGAGMRLDSIDWFPKQMTLGAIQSDSLIYAIGKQVAIQLKRLGVHINFAPVADINNNPLNPVINARSFGENREKVSVKAAAYMHGMQDNGIIAVAKHFPGHGDTGKDSHYTLPLISKSKQVLDSLELYPFRNLIDQGIQGVMVSHLTVPALDSASKAMATLSWPTITGLLRNEMKFNGLIITDGMDMKGLTDFSDPGRVEADALQAGNDILLLPVDAVKAVENISVAIDSGYLSESLVNEKCLKILRWKFRSGLSNLQLPETGNDLMKDINTEAGALLTREADAGAITIASDPQLNIPLDITQERKIACISFGDTIVSPFQERLSSYACIDHYSLAKEPSTDVCDSIVSRLKNYDLIINAFIKTSDLPQKNFGLSAAALRLADSLSALHKSINVFFTSPYALGLIGPHLLHQTLVVAYQDNATMQDLTAQAIVGSLPVTGTLPVSATNIFKAGTGEQRSASGRMPFGLPAQAGMMENKLQRIDSIMQKALCDSVFPGAQIVIARGGVITYCKSFGLIEPGGRRVTNSDLYDLASLTKVLSTTLEAMKLVSDGVLDPDKKLSDYYHKLRHSNKSQRTMREIMAHQAGFLPYIRFYDCLLHDKSAGLQVITSKPDADHTVQVADSMFIANYWPEYIIDSIIESPLLKGRKYTYSDLGFIILSKAFESITLSKANEYLMQNFYSPMGLNRIGYLPLERFQKSGIVPTENDTIFRNQLIRGYVHDPTASMLGGVAGHAGLFSNATDVAVLMQMLLQKGVYAGKQYVKRDVIEDFTRVQFPDNHNRRGAGFDKPAPPNEPTPCSVLASPLSYGHSGFTGTFIWADPQYDLVYVFLSNRICPSASNNKITKMNIRTSVQDIIYESMVDFKYDFSDIAQ